MASVVATRRGKDERMGIFDAPDPLDELKRDIVIDSRRTWLKLAYIAKVLAARNIRSKVSGKRVTRMDVAREANANLIQTFEAEHGAISDEELRALEGDDEDPQPEPPVKRKPAAKKGGAR